jgi:hypothetical protein
LGILILLVGAVIAGAFLKLFADHRAFRRELREQREQLETVLDIVSTVALSAGDELRVRRVERSLRPKGNPGREPSDD